MSDASSGNDKPGSGSGLDSAALEKLISDKVSAAVHARISRTEEKLAQIVSAEISKLGTSAKPEKQNKPEVEGDQGSDQQRLSMRALESKINELTQQIAKRDEALTQERQRVVDSQMRGEVREALAQALGADNKNIGLVMDSLYDAKKRFAQGEGGTTLVKFKSAYGDEEALPLKDGIKRLVESELSHLVPSKAAQLPGGVRVNGQPMAGKPNGASRANPLDQMLSTVAASVVSAGAGGKE